MLNSSCFSATLMKLSENETEITHDGGENSSKLDIEALKGWQTTIIMTK